MLDVVISISTDVSTILTWSRASQEYRETESDLLSCVSLSASRVDAKWSRIKE